MKIKILLVTIALFLGSLGVNGQTTVTVGGGATITCPATPTATWTTPPAGVTFSNWSRGSGVTCVSAANGLSGSGFNSTNATTGFTANAYYSVILTAASTHTFTLNDVVWNTAVSGGNPNFTIEYVNNGGTRTTLGTAGQTSKVTNTFTAGSTITVAAGTSIVLYLIPAGADTAGRAIRWLNTSTISITATATSATPTLTTPTATAITTATATLGATVTSDNGSTITSRGTVWGTSAGPTGNSITTTGTTGVFTTPQTGFSANTLYTYRGFAINGNGTGYSPDANFTTLHNAPNIGAGSGATSTSIAANWTAPTSGGAASFTYQIQVDDDSAFGSVNYTQSNIASGTISVTANTGLIPSTTYFYRVRAVNAGGNSAWSATSVGYATTASQPNNALNLKACRANNQIALSWNVASGATGYLVFALPSTSIPQMAVASAGNASGYIANTDFSAATTYTTLGRAVYKGSATSAIITGLTNLSQYTFKVVAYNGETGTGWAGINTNEPTNSWNQTFISDVPEISNLAASVNLNSSTVTWNVVPSSAGCYEYMVVANAGPLVFTPTGNGTAYTANAVYGGTNQVVFKGSGNSVIVTGLTEGVNYCYRVFVREVNSGNQWSDGTSICQTTALVYCSSAGTTADATGITSVVFNTINQPSANTNAYTDYTAVSTTVLLGATHNLIVKVNTFGFQNATEAWIDWNRDGDFNDSGEEFDLGYAFDGLDEITSNSPLSITVPANATTGATRMRVATQYFFDDSDIILTPCANYTFGEVEDYTINIAQPLTAEINVKGSNISIPNGFDAPFTFNNTLFTATPLNTDSAVRTFTIENIGVADLNLTGSPRIKIEGLHPSDFIVTQQAATPVVNGAPAIFEIKFNPTVAGTRTATVRIESDDSNENPYLFTVEGTGTCAAVPSIAMFPASGPINTLVSFTSSTSSLTGASVIYNNTTLPLVSVATDKIEVVIPANANDGNFTIQLANGCGITQAFDVIDTQLSSCENSSGGGSDASDLIIYEVYDEKSGSGGVVSIYNRTGATVDLAGYSIKRASTYGGTYSTYANLSGTIVAGSLAVIGVTPSPCGYATTGNGSFGSSGFNADDGFRLEKETILIDDVRTPNYTGYYLKRKNTNLNPNVLFNNSEWLTQSVAASECLTGVATAPILRVPPTVTLNSQYLINCAIKNTSLTVAGTEGVAAGLPLAYQWYVLGTTGNWTAISNGGIYSGATSPTLNISDLSGLDDFQYYCQIRENGVNCYAASTASQLRISKKTWNGTVWSGDGITPTFTEKAVITGTYNSLSHGGDLNACECEVTSTGIVTMNLGHTLNVQGAINNAGSINILDTGSIVQRLDSAINTGIISMQRKTKPVFRFDYTYWSSPVFEDGDGIKEAGEFNLFDLSPTTLFDKYFKWNHNGSVPLLVPGWQLINNGTEAMVPGRGYIVRAPQGFPTEVPLTGSALVYTANFVGKPNNGVVNHPVSGSTVVGSERWNLLGNPYPSAIDATAFLNLNAPAINPTLGGTLYFWTHNTSINSNSPNYSPNDYASWNGTGSTATLAGADGAVGEINGSIPTGNIAAGQGFFVKGLANGVATFNNGMRIAGENNQFFKGLIAEEHTTNTTPLQKHRVWLNLKGPVKGFNQTLVGYIENATNDFDNRFDGESFGGNLVTFYSINNTKNLVIQGRALPFINTDTVPLGYKTTLTGNLTISIDHVDGLMEDQDIYLQDNLLNVVHDLKASNYTFASVPGTFNTRFVLRYLPQENLSNPTFDDQIKAVRIYKNDATLYVSSPYETIATVAVYDLTGRLVFERKNCNTNRFETDELLSVDQALIVKVTLSNGGVVTEKVL